jgi:hypothetical protein
MDGISQLWFIAAARRSLAHAEREPHRTSANPAGPKRKCNLTVTERTGDRSVGWSGQCCSPRDPGSRRPTVGSRDPWRSPSSSYRRAHNAGVSRVLGGALVVATSGYVAASRSRRAAGVLLAALGRALMACAVASLCSCKFARGLRFPWLSLGGGDLLVEGVGVGLLVFDSVEVLAVDVGERGAV